MLYFAETQHEIESGGNEKHDFRSSGIRVSHADVNLLPADYGAEFAAIKTVTKLIYDAINIIETELSAGGAVHVHPQNALRC